MGSDTVTVVTNSVNRHDQSIDLEPEDMCSCLEWYHWINSNSHMIRKVLFADEVHFTRDGVKNTRNSHLRERDNPHGTVESSYQHRFSVNVWCGVIGD